MNPLRLGFFLPGVNTPNSPPSCGVFFLCGHGPVPSAPGQVCVNFTLCPQILALAWHIVSTRSHVMNVCMDAEIPLDTGGSMLASHGLLGEGALAQATTAASYNRYALRGTT